MRKGLLAVPLTVLLAPFAAAREANDEVLDDRMDYDLEDDDDLEEDLGGDDA